MVNVRQDLYCDHSVDIPGQLGTISLFDYIVREVSVKVFMCEERRHCTMQPDDSQLHTVRIGRFPVCKKGLTQYRWPV